MIIKFTILYKQTWVDEFTGVFEMRLEKRLTMDDVCHSSKDIATGVAINAGKKGKFHAVDYYYDCGNVSESVMMRAINMFNSHYNGEYLALGRTKIEDNEFVDNFKIALAKAATTSSGIFEQSLDFTNEKPEWKALVRSKNSADNCAPQEAAITSRL